MSNEEIIKRLSGNNGPNWEKEMERMGCWGDAKALREAIALVRTHPPAGDNAEKNSDTSARLAAIKDIPTQRLIELAVAEAAVEAAKTIKEEI